MQHTESPPKNPAGPFVPEADSGEDRRSELIDSIAAAPTSLRKAVAGLGPSQLNTRYRNWSIRQIVHHLADSHVHSYIRFKWALTEDVPTIKAYNEGDWAMLPDAEQGDIAPALLLLDGLHAKWTQLLHSMTGEGFERAFHHPQAGETVTLRAALSYYAWHGRHHTAQITWLRKKHGWG